MEIRWSGEGRALSIALSGELDHHAAKEALHTLDALIDKRLPLECRLDLSGLSFMDSSGIAVILGLYKRVFELSGELTVENVPPQAMRVISAAGIDKIVTFDMKEMYI
ncbi:MAG: STAS domain-containing protein [Oscillospiraceae bacterium]|jgi:stage II sporulation protein AA (anti-sigma F factor antagonist)|nr:STAS domain-containing protein [Oscillospiraceae bacterium]